MSVNAARKFRIVPNQVRDFHLEHEGSADYTVTLVRTHGVVGLDFRVFNRGAADITYQLDGGSTITVPSHGSRGYDNTKFTLLRVTAAVAFSVMIAGVYINGGV